jgi:hypothetical protein
MKTRRGRPRKGSEKAKAILLQVRLDPSEKQAFAMSAQLSGLELSAWVRERLRWAATRELEAAAKPIPFLNYDDEA